MLGLHATDRIAIVNWHADLSVHAEVGFFFSGLDLNFDFDRIAYDYGPMRQPVR